MHRHYKDQRHYDVQVLDWRMNVYFNEYAHINLFKNDPFEERCYMTILGQLADTNSKKVKKNQKTQIVLHPSEYWYKTKNFDTNDLSIGDVEFIKNDWEEEGGRILLFRISAPTKSYENIRSYIAAKQSGNFEFIGKELFRNNAKISYFSFKAGAY